MLSYSWLLSRWYRGTMLLLRSSKMIEVPVLLDRLSKNLYPHWLHLILFSGGSLPDDSSSSFYYSTGSSHFIPHRIYYSSLIIALLAIDNLISFFCSRFVTHIDLAIVYISIGLLSKQQFRAKMSRNGSLSIYHSFSSLIRSLISYLSAAIYWCCRLGRCLVALFLLVIIFLRIIPRLRGTLLQLLFFLEIMKRKSFIHSRCSSLCERYSYSWINDHLLYLFDSSRH